MEFLFAFIQQYPVATVVFLLGVVLSVYHYVWPNPKTPVKRRDK